MTKSYTIYHYEEGTITELDTAQTEKEAKTKIQKFYQDDQKNDCFVDYSYGYVETSQKDKINPHDGLKAYEN